jgi:hypothetical protein
MFSSRISNNATKTDPGFKHRTLFFHYIPFLSRQPNRESVFFFKKKKEKRTKKTETSYLNAKHITFLPQHRNEKHQNPDTKTSKPTQTHMNHKKKNK